MVDNTKILIILLFFRITVVIHVCRALIFGCTLPIFRLLVVSSIRNFDHSPTSHVINAQGKVAAEYRSSRESHGGDEVIRQTAGGDVDASNGQGAESRSPDGCRERRRADEDARRQLNEEKRNRGRSERKRRAVE